MSEINTHVVNGPVHRSVAISRELGIQGLLDALESRSGLSRTEIAAAFAGLRRLMESLPLTTEEFGLATNWVESARQLWEQGEPGAARDQVDLVRKKFGL
ncbi:MAG: hypothetical protein ACLQBX_08230 [Candidatus Limnocylindrales bacterium]